jgi:hypothetical protein
MAEKIDDITINYEENGVLLVKELDKEILTRGGWTTILFRYQEWSAKTQDYGPDKYMIRRYRKIGGEFRSQSKFAITNPDQARKIIDTLSKWLEDAGEQ